MICLDRNNDLFYISHITAGTLVPSSVNGDIAIQWEWSNFDPSQNPNPLTDYDKTAQLITSTRRTCNPKPVKERLAKCVKYKASLFIFIFNFFLGLAYWSNPCMEFRARWLKTRVVTQGSAFWGSTRWPTAFWGSNSPKTVKMAVCKHVQASAKRPKTNDVIEDWRHWLAVASRPSGVYYL